MALFKNRFDKQFEGYERRTVYDNQGNEKTKYVYVKEYFSPQLSDREFIIRKVINWVLFIVMGVLQGWAGTRQVAVNFMTVVTAFQGISVVGMIILIIYLARHTAASLKMKIDQHKNAHDKFMAMSLIEAIALICASLAMLVYSFFDTITRGATEYLAIGAYALAAVCSAVMWFLERRGPNTKCCRRTRFNHSV